LEIFFRELSALGCLVPADRFQLLSGYKAAPPSGTASGVSDQPNIMSLCVAPPQRFQLLPMAAATGGGVGGQLGEGGIVAGSGRQGGPLSSFLPPLDAKAPAATKTSVKRSRSPVSSTAASFFGSMSSSWFGGTATS
jgi:hypothetical protein